MIYKTVKMNRNKGFYARTANELVKTASQFSSDIYLIHNGRKVNAKSVLGLLSLAIPKQAEITLEFSGEDEFEAIQEIVNRLEIL